MMINLYSNSIASSSSIASIGSRIRVNYKLVIVTTLNPNSFSIAFRLLDLFSILISIWIW
ncbi:hypothetical protein Hanom_Chr05g00398151 [Helianthus anomalus]